MSSTRDDLIWLTAFWEGEGSVGLYQHNQQYKTGKIYRSKALAVSLAQNDKNILLWVKKDFGGSVHKVTPNGKCYRLQLTGPKALFFLEVIQPFVKTEKRRREVSMAIEQYRAFKAIAKGRV